MVPAVLKLRNMLWDIVVLCCSDIHECAEVCGEDEMGFQLVHRLQAEPHAMSI